MKPMKPHKYLELLCVEGQGFQSYTISPHVAKEYGVSPDWVHCTDGMVMEWAAIASKLIGRPLTDECILIREYHPKRGHLAPTMESKEEIPEEDLQAACRFLLDEEPPKFLENQEPKVEVLKDIPPGEEIPQEAVPQAPMDDMPLETSDVYEGFEDAPEVSYEERERRVGKQNLVRNVGQLGGYSQSEYEDRILARRMELVPVLPVGEASRTEDVCRVALLGDLVIRRRNPPEASEVPQSPSGVVELLELGSPEGIAYTLSPTTQKWVHQGVRMLLPQWTTEGPLAVAIQKLTGFSREKVATLDVRVRVIPALET